MIIKLVSMSAILLSFASYADTRSSEYDAYCIQQGGAVVEMPARFHTSAGDVDGNIKAFCRFEVNDGLVLIGLETFASNRPSIAASYMKRLKEFDEQSPLWTGNASNPSYNVCKNLSGTTISFVLNGSFTDADGESDVCVFGDGSMVSAWSLIYMANHRDGYDDIKNHVRSEALDFPLQF